jgi:FAD/FMN-containing dehydrogenase
MTIERERDTAALTRPGDDGWDAARLAWNLAVDQHPAAVARPATVADVQDAVTLARREGWRIAAQSTGHGAHALGPLDEVLLLKTTRMRDVRVGDGVVRAEAGVLAGEAAAAAGAHGLAPALGFAPTVGVAGLTLGGGIGWLSRSHGLAANNVRAFDVVLASGDHVRVDADNEPDLFWALRGGGGRGVIVTALELTAHPLPAAFGGTVAWPAEHAREVLEQFRRVTAQAPEALTLVFRHIVPAKLVALTAVYLGSEDDAVRALAPLRNAGGVLSDTFGPVGAADLVRIAEDPEEPAASAVDGLLLDDLTRDTVDRLEGLINDAALAPLGVIELRHLGGALARAPQGHGAQARLNGAYAFMAVGLAPDPGVVATIAARHDELREALAPWTARQAVLNTARAGIDPADAFETQAWRRLERARAAYDPEGRLISTHDLYAGTR